MRFAVISDIHGNLTALEAVLADIDAEEPAIDLILCAGDIVGHSAHPNEVITLLREREIQAVRGNYDEVAAGYRNYSGSDYASSADESRDIAALTWTNKQLTSDSLAYLKGLPAEMRIEVSPAGRLSVKVQKEDKRVSDYRGSYVMGLVLGSYGTKRKTRASVGTTGIVIVHATPRDTVEYLYPGTAETIFKSVAADAAANIIIFGHTHQSFQKTVDNVVFVGVGSVGRPLKPGLAEYGIFELVGVEFDLEFRQVEYDAEHEARAIEATELPRDLAERLRPTV